LIFQYLVYWYPILFRNRNIREHAHAYFAANPFFTSWDADVLRVYIEHGLVEEGTTGSVKTKMSPIDEGVVAEARTLAEMWELAKTLDERVGLFWIMAKGPNGYIPMEELAQKLVWRRPVNSQNVVFDCGHLVRCRRDSFDLCALTKQPWTQIQMEKPKQLGENIQFYYSEHTAQPDMQRMLSLLT
jgi:hypothetical protein